MELTVVELDQMVDKSFELQKEYKKAKKLSGVAYAELEEHKANLIQALFDLGKTKYSTDSGTFAYTVDEKFRVPKDTENREKFFAHLKEKGVFENMITVPSATINAWAQVEVEANKDNWEYSIPGLEKCPPTFKASMRKA